MLRSKLETRLRGLIAFSVLAVMGALVSGTSAQYAPSEMCTVSSPGTSRVMILNVQEEPVQATGHNIKVVRIVPDASLPQPPLAPLPPQPPVGVVL